MIVQCECFTSKKAKSSKINDQQKKKKFSAKNCTRKLHMDDRFRIKYTKTNREMAAKKITIQQQQHRRQDDVMENGEKKAGVQSRNNL